MAALLAPIILIMMQAAKATVNILGIQPAISMNDLVYHDKKGEILNIYPHLIIAWEFR
jgi:hypothetical protein